MRRRLILASVVLALASGSARAEQPVTVFAAASLKGALGDIGAAWAKAGHAKLKLSLDSSGTLAKQIQQGAPAQIFFSADEKWMDYLAHDQLIVAASRTDLLGNTLVLVVPADHPRKIVLKPGFDLAALLGKDGRLSVGDPASVPAGIYARQALDALGAWDYAQDRLAPGANVKSALLAVETGEAPAGIVYGSDAKGDKKVVVAGMFPANSHDKISYPIALVAKLGETPDAKAAFAFLKSPAALAIYNKYGFSVQ